jgi:hypothetical protein
MSDFGIGVKSVQRGIVTLNTNPKTVTITAVVLAKSLLISSYSRVDYSKSEPRAVLTDTTTITFDQAVTDANSLVAWQVIEFY